MIFQPPQRRPAEYTGCFQLPCACEHGSCTVRFHNVERSAGAILFTHGNAEDLGLDNEQFCRRLSEATSFCVLAVEYCGYGPTRDERAPSELCCLANALAGYRWLVEQRYITSDRIYLFGRSLGCVPVCRLATKQPCAGLILCSPFYSAREMARHLVGPTLALLGSAFVNLNGFANSKAAPHVPCRVFIAHGQQDDVVPISQAERLSNLFPGQVTRYWTPAGHNDMFSSMNWEMLLQQLIPWLRQTKK